MSAMPPKQTSHSGHLDGFLKNIIKCVVIKKLPRVLRNQKSKFLI